MKDIAKFSNLHQGQTIVVCGCGESLNEFAEPGCFITIGVNDVGRRFQPNYLVVVNPPNQFSGDRFRYVETSQAEYLFTQLDLGVKHPNIVKFQLGQFGGTDFSNPNILHYTNNSPYIALCLAFLMGAKRIGLIGIDFTDHHFFSKTGRHPLAPQFEAINEQYHRLAKAAESLGIGIFNLSGISRLTAFPKMTLGEFENLSQSLPENTEKNESLKIVSYATTPIAGVPAILARCINDRTTHSARCVWATNDYGNGVNFAGDVEWRKQPQVAESLLAEADLIIVHNGKTAPEHEKLFKDKAIITMAHNYLWNVDEQFFKKGFPRLVVGQYQATLLEFKDWSVVPNPIPFWEAEYQPGSKPDQIAICYTPSGKHERYAPEHKLYWHSKGYETTMKILEKLSRQFPLKLEVITNRQISHAESLAMKMRSHIVIDECVTGSYHRNSLEGLSGGCVVVNGLGILPEVADVLRLCSGESAEIPFVSATLENLERILTELIESRKDTLIQKGLKNRLWLEKNWNFERHWQRFWMPVIEKSLKKIKGDILFDKPAQYINSNEVNGGVKMREIKEGVSIVIPHGGKDRLPHLRACLANLRQCADVGEIIVVEMDKTPLAAEIARKWADKYVFIHRSDLFERARALNTGSTFAECEFVLWLDNDLLMPHDFFTKAVAEIRSRRLDYLKPYAETAYLNAADSENVMQGIRNPEACRPANVVYGGGSGRAEITRKDFLMRCGGIPDGFRGWGGEDNAWSHKAYLLGKAGATQNRSQKLFHLFHLLSGGYGGEQHKAANPHYQANVALFNKIYAVRDAKQFLETFPPQKYSPWNIPQKIVFVAGKTAESLAKTRQTAQWFEELLGAQVEIISFDGGAGKISADLSEKQPDAIIFFDKPFSEELLSDKDFAGFVERSVLIADDDFDVNEVENLSLTILTKHEPIESTRNNPKIWFRKNEKPEETDFQSLALALAQPLSVILGKSQSEFRKNIASSNQPKTELPVWFYWEGVRPDWIEACHQTILAKNQNARFLTSETFAELWTEDRDIDISHLYVAHRADFIRAYLLAKFGGLWLDADCVVMQDLQFLLDKLDKYDFIAHRERNGLFTNDLMAAKPGSVIAREFYENICRTLRTTRTIGWRAIGGDPLTQILNKKETIFLELDCEQIQPICWSEPEKFFAAGSESEHLDKFDERAICYMLSNGAVINYQKKYPNASLTAADTFFSFAVRRALSDQKTNGNNPAHDKDLQFQSKNNGANPETQKIANRRHTVSFYLEMIAKIAPQKVLDIDVGLGRWAVLLRDLFESSNDKKQWQMSIEAIVEEKPKSKDLSKFFYNRVRVGALDECLKSLEEKPDLLILGDYLTRDSSVESEKILERMLNFSDYILLNVNRNKNNNGSNLSNNVEGLFRYLELQIEQVAAYQAKEDSASFLLSQNDPKKLRPKSRMTDVFYDMAQLFTQQRMESISGPGSSLAQTAEIRRRLPLLFASLEINSMLDAPCGDHNWLRHVDLKLEKYVGIDVVPSIIEQNRNRYENQIKKFYVSDITKDFLPQCDLIFCRDYLVHLSFTEIFAALRNFCNSDAKYLLMTTFPNTQVNADIQTGGWRTLNFQIAPFHFPAPIRLLNERCTENNGKFADKSLGLWKISDIEKVCAEKLN